MSNDFSVLESSSFDGQRKTKRFGKTSDHKIENSVAFRKFAYSAIRSDGEAESGQIVSTSFSEAKYKLEASGLEVEKISSIRPWWAIEVGKVVPASEVLQLCRQLSSFAQAGIPLAKGLAVLGSSTEHKRLRQAVEEMRMEIEGGASFSEAINHQGNIFPGYFVPIISAAERTGSISEALATLNEYLERDLRSKRAVKSAMSYPVVLLFLAVLAISILSIVVLPRFESFFESLNVELPLPTKILLTITRFLGTWWWALLAIIGAVTFGYLVARKNSKTKLILDRIKLRAPVFGGLAQLVAVERFCRILSTLVRSQVPLPEALVLAGKGTSNRVFEEGVKKAQIEVLNGAGLSTPLSKLNCFPAVAIQILRVGEESGQLEVQLAQASSFYSDELDFRLKNFTALVEPVVLIVLGGGIGFVAVALISAMYGIYSGVQG